MSGTRTAYAALVVGAVFFFILYRGTLSLILLIFALIFPWLLLFMLRTYSRSLRVNVNVPELPQDKQATFPVQIHLQNPSPLPIPYAAVSLSYRNSMTDLEEELSVTTLVPAKQGQTIQLQLSSDYCGRLLITLRQIVLTDYLRLWKIRHTSKVCMEVLVLPKIWPIQTELLPNAVTNQESDTFSQTRSGDDPSEVFALRDYQPGDSPSRIHWKISSKRETPVIKEYSLPITNTACLVLSWLPQPLPVQETLLETALSLSDALAVMEQPHSVSWYDAERGQLMTQQISEPEDCNVTTGRLLRTTPSDTNFSVLEGIGTHTPMSHLVFITAVFNDGIAAMLSEMNAPRKTVLYITETPDTPDCREELAVISVTPGAVSAIEELLL